MRAATIGGRLLFLSLSSRCGCYSRAVTIRDAASIWINTVPWLFIWLIALTYYVRQNLSNCLRLYRWLGKCYISRKWLLRVSARGGLLSSNLLEYYYHTSEIYFSYIIEAPFSLIFAVSIHMFGIEQPILILCNYVIALYAPKLTLSLPICKGFWVYISCKTRLLC